jgi:cellulose synthase (UDP-forming)
MSTDYSNTLNRPTKELSTVPINDSNDFNKFNLKNFVSTWNKYLYVSQDVSNIRLNYFFGLIALILALISYFGLFTLNSLFTLFFGLIFSFMAFGEIVTVGLGLFYPKFDLEKHENKVISFWQKNYEPSVDIFLPVCGEDISIITNTWQYVKHINYSNYKVYVLDDGGSLSVKNLAHEFNFHYLSRPNKGQYKKSGNLQYGYDNSNSEFVMIFDADFAPHPDCLYDTIPYIVEDKKISILQTPQFFDINKKILDSSQIQYGAASSVEDFYRLIMPSRNYFKACMCVGTSAIMRRQAIIDCGGTPKDEGSEDIRQGLMTMKVGYYVQYLPIILSKGICPDNIELFYKQQVRWCTGSIKTTFSHYFLDAKMSIYAKIWYLTSTAFYLGGALMPLWSLHLFVLLYFYTDRINWVYAMAFLPLILYKQVFNPLNKLCNVTSSTKLVSISQLFIFLHAIILLVSGKNMKWIPAGVNNKSQDIDKDFQTFYHIAFGFALMCSFLLLNRIIFHPYLLTNFNTIILILTCLSTIYSYWQVVFHCRKYIINKAQTNINIYNKVSTLNKFSQSLKLP